MAVSFAGADGGTFNATTCNVSTAGSALGDIIFVIIAKTQTGVAVTPAAGFISILSDFTNLQFQAFYKPIKVAGDITATNTFTVAASSQRGAVMAIGMRGLAVENVLSTYKAAIQSNNTTSAVDFATLTSVRAASFYVGWVDTYDSSGNFFGTTAPLPAGYTDSGLGSFDSYGLGTPRSIRLFYALNVGGNVDPPDTVPGGGHGPNDFGWITGSYAFRKYDAQQVA